MLFSNLFKKNLTLIVSKMKRTTSGRTKPVSKMVKSETVNKKEDDVHEVKAKRSTSKVVKTQKIDENEEVVTDIQAKVSETQNDASNSSKNTRVSQRTASNAIKSQTAIENEDDEPKAKIFKKPVSKVMKSDQGNQNKDSKPTTLKSQIKDEDKDVKQNPSTSQAASESSDFVEKFQKSRLATAESILDFDFKKKRVRVLSKTDEVKENAEGGILYWMFRDMRVQDNWAFLFAQKLALKNHLPLHVCFCLLPNFLNATIRHYKFLMKGLQEVEDECHELNITFHLFHGTGPENIPKFIKNNSIGALVCDLSPLNLPKKWVEDVKNNLPSDIPFCLVDSHDIVPVWIASDKQEYAARTIRNKINEKLKIFLTEFPPLIKHPYLSNKKYDKIDWNSGYKFIKCDQIIDEVEWAKPGYRAACKELQNFCENRLKKFHDKRNDPTINALSNLSPWFHFGNISVQRCILTVNKYKSKYPESVAAFCEEAIVRRELSENFCYYNKNYDNLQGIASWALKTLNDHRKDKRDYIYELKEFEEAKTHDDLWNSAQIQLIKEGKMHGFLRMYWAKKILEWTETPEKALEIAIYLNDKYNLDGRDPNGYVGCMWSIGGVHDQGWTERPIFGKIRYMNYQGCKRKFDVAAFVARYGGKVYKKK